METETDQRLDSDEDEQDMDNDGSEVVALAGR